MLFPRSVLTVHTFQVCEDGSSKVYRDGERRCSLCDGVGVLEGMLFITICALVTLTGQLMRRYPRFASKFVRSFDAAKLRVCWVTFQIMGSIKWAMDEGDGGFPPPFSIVEQMASSVTQVSISQVRAVRPTVTV